MRITRKDRNITKRGLIGASLFWTTIIIYLLCQCTITTANAIHQLDRYVVNTSYKLFHAPLINPVVDLNPKVEIIKTVEASEIEMPTPSLPPSHQQKEIEAYIKTIFGPDAHIAIAVSHNECNPLNSKYPACILHSEVEYSVGLFQINLYNSQQWIHAARIPGSTMEEKAEWLKDPYNNTLYAYWVFKKSGWHPWSAYTSGNYLKDL